MEINVVLDECGNKEEIMTISISHVVLNLNTGLSCCVQKVVWKQLISQELVVGTLVYQDWSVDILSL